MPALMPTGFVGEIVWLGRVTGPAPVLASLCANELFASFPGIAGEVHEGLTRPSCSRVTAQYPKGTVIRNTRQISLVSEEELAGIAAGMGIARLSPAELGATMCLRGIPDFTHVPPSSRLQGDGGATLVVDMQNLPCTIPAKAIERLNPGHGARFKAAAVGRRGVTAWVEREGFFRVGDRVRLHVPDQRAWAQSGTLTGRQIAV